MARRGRPLRGDDRLELRHEFQLSVIEAAALRRVAEEMGLSLSELIRQALAVYIQDYYRD